MVNCRVIARIRITIWKHKNKIWQRTRASAKPPLDMATFLAAAAFIACVRKVTGERGKT